MFYHNPVIYGDGSYITSQINGGMGLDENTLSEILGVPTTGSRLLN